MSYARSGMGMGPTGVFPVFRRTGFRSFDGLGALGAVDTPTTVSVTVIQRGLIAAGVSPSPGGVDGKWGPNTRASLREFMASTRISGVDNARAIAALPPGTPTGARSVTIPNAYASRLESLSGSYRAGSSSSSTTTTSSSGGSSSSVPATTSDSGVVAPDGGASDVMSWLPWAIGATALVGVGGYFVYRGQKKKRVARNRRRRRSSRRR